MEKVAKQYDMEIGVLLRGSVKRAILQYCAKQNINVAVTEAKGLLDSFYVFTITGTEYQHIQFRKFLRVLQKHIDQED